MKKNKNERRNEKKPSLLFLTLVSASFQLMSFCYLATFLVPDYLAVSFYS